MTEDLKFWIGVALGIFTLFLIALLIIVDSHKNKKQLKKKSKFKLVNVYKNVNENINNFIKKFITKHKRWLFIIVASLSWTFLDVNPVFINPLRMLSKNNLMIIVFISKLIWLNLTLYVYKYVMDKK